MDCFLDEDESHQGGEALLCEPGDVADVSRGISHQDDEEEEASPETDPEAEGKKVPAKTPGRCQKVRSGRQDQVNLVFLLEKVIENCIKDNSGPCEAHYVQRGDQGTTCKPP